MLLPILWLLFLDFPTRFFSPQSIVAHSRWHQSIDCDIGTMLSTVEHVHIPVFVVLPLWEIKIFGNNTTIPVIEMSKSLAAPAHHWLWLNWMSMGRPSDRIDYAEQLNWMHKTLTTAPVWQLSGLCSPAKRKARPTGTKKKLYCVKCCACEMSMAFMSYCGFWFSVSVSVSTHISRADGGKCRWRKTLYVPSESE